MAKKNPKTVDTNDPEVAAEVAEQQEQQQDTPKRRGRAKKEPTAELLPKGQERLADGTIRLKTGHHENLEDAVYDVHGARLRLAGGVFVAGGDVNWIPIRKCVCRKDRPTAVRTFMTDNGRTVTVGECDNHGQCAFAGKKYLWVHEGEVLVHDQDTISTN